MEGIIDTIYLQDRAITLFSSENAMRVWLRGAGLRIIKVDWGGINSPPSVTWRF